MFIILLGNIDFRMKKELWYLGFLNQKGRPLSADYQSEEKALSVEDALHKLDDEERAGYLQRSYDKAKEGIMESKKAADRLGKKCYIVLVTEYIHLT